MSIHAAATLRMLSCVTSKKKSAGHKNRLHRESQVSVDGFKSHDMSAILEDKTSPKWGFNQLFILMNHTDIFRNHAIRDNNDLQSIAIHLIFSDFLLRLHRRFVYVAV